MLPLGRTINMKACMLLRMVEIARSQKLTIYQGQGRYIRPGHPDFYVDERPPDHVGSDDEDSDFGPPQGAADDEEPGTPQSERSS